MSRSRSRAKRFRGGKGNSTIIEEDVSMQDVLSEEESVKPKRGAKSKRKYEEEDVSILDEEFSDDEDFDTVSKVLRPSGVAKEKVMYENEYDEACSKL